MLFLDLAIYLQKLEQTTSRNSITEILAELFHKLHPDEIGKVCYLLQGRVAPLYDAIEFGLADKFVIRAIALANEIDSDEVVRSFKKHGDLGAAAEELRGGKHGKEVSILKIFEKLFEITQTGGVGSQEKKIAILADLLKESNSLSARYLVRIPLDKLRLGFSDMTILDALSWMQTGDKSLRPKLESAYNVRTDIGFIAGTVKDKGIVGLSRVKATVGAPILASLCQRLPTADEMIEKMGTVAVEPKYDGVRTQIHFKRSGIHGLGQVASYSRNLENTTAMYPELTDIAKHLHADEVILDSEAIGVDPKTGKLMSFQETTTRKRKHNIEEQTKTVPLKFFVFDMMVKDGTDLLTVPLSERRKLLEKTIKPGELLEISPKIVTDNADTLRTYHDEQLKKGLEGVVIKKWDSGYEPGRKNYNWVKFKEEEGKTGKLADTIDTVVMGYYVGQGKRAGFGIGAFLVGVLKGEEVVTVTKVGTGVSDDLWKRLYTKLHALQAKEKPKEYGEVNKIFEPDVWVRPDVIVEIAGDDLTKSPTHGAGYAVRFPRLVRIREDKSLLQITTVKEIEKMFSMQKSTHKK